MLRRIICSFSKLKKEDIETSNYNQLVQKMGKLYGYQQFKTKSSLTLLEMHHKYKIFKEGDKVLNIASGKAWTQMIVKYTRSLDHTPNVITVSSKQTLPTKGTHLIKGDLSDSQTKVAILQHLNESSFDVALMNTLPNYTGFTEVDGFKLNTIVVNTLGFLDKFLKKGGIFICKSFETSESNQLHKTMLSIFKDVYKHRVSFISTDSPMFYYVLKGFGISKQALLLEEFIKQYNNAGTNRRLIMNKYQQKGLKAKQILQSQIQQRIFDMMKRQIPEQQILSEFYKEHFLNPQMFIDKWKQLQTLKKEGSRREIHNYMKKQFGQSYNLSLDVPQDAVQAMEVFQQIHQIFQQQKRQSSSKKDRQDQLLGRDQVYMKDNSDPQQILNKNIYLQREVNEDVAGQYDQSFHQELQKFKKTHPQYADFLTKLQNDQLSIQEISQKMGTHQLYQPQHDKIRTQFKKDIQKAEKIQRQQITAQSLNSQKVQGGSRRHRAYVKNRQYKKK